MIYLDTTYLGRLYIRDSGYAAVRRLAVDLPVACCILGRAEMASALHRKLREGSLSAAEHGVMQAEFNHDCLRGAFHWFPLTNGVIERVSRLYAAADAAVFLRASDAIHLACAAENGFDEIYSNDRHLLAAAPHFNLAGINIL